MHLRACCIGIGTLWACLLSPGPADAGDVWLRLVSSARRASIRFVQDDAPTDVPPAPAIEEGDTASAGAEAAVQPDVPPSAMGKTITLEGPNAGKVDDGAEPAESEEKSSTGALVFTYIPGNGDQLGLFGFDFRSVPSPDMPQTSTLTMNTGWGITWVDGPHSTDLPPQLYHVTLDLGGIGKIDDTWTVDLALTPAWFTDWENRRPEAFRLMGRAVGYYRIDQELQVAAGFVYLNRDDIPALPVAGVIFDNPTAGRRWELVFPRPKVSWRWKETDEASRWFYVNGELGGGSWAIKRVDRTPDVLTYRDLRLVGGLEFRRKKGRRAAIEAGWVFARSIETRTQIGDYRPNDAFMTRLWLDY